LLLYLEMLVRYYKTILIEVHKWATTHRGVKCQKLRWITRNFTCNNYEYVSSTLLQVYINGNNSNTSRQHTYIISYYSIIRQNIAKNGCFWQVISRVRGRFRLEEWHRTTALNYQLLADTFSQFFWDQKNIDESRSKPWATPLLKHQESVDCIFDPKNEDFYYSIYKTK